MPSPVKIQARITEARFITASVLSLSLAPLGRVPEFRPGQFLHLALDRYDPSAPWPDSRVFSIASSPADRSVIRILISAKGSFTKRILESARTGETVWLKLPYGDFTINDAGKDIVLIAGGTGISPFVSFLESNAVKSLNHGLFLYYGVRSPGLVIFDELIEACRKNYPCFQATLYCEEGTTAPGIKSGKIDINGIYEKHGQNADYYLSGPWPMIGAFRARLESGSVDARNIHIDAWE